MSLRTRMSASIAMAVTLLSHALHVAAQAPLPGYTPLFSQEQIRNASDSTRQRMLDTEREHREAWLQRNAAQRATQPGGDEREEEADDPRPVESTGEGVRAVEQPAPRPSRPSRIYRWVDDDGQVHFGDRPTARGAREVKLRDRSTTPAASVTRESD